MIKEGEGCIYCIGTKCYMIDRISIDGHRNTWVCRDDKISVKAYIVFIYRSSCL